MSGWPSLPARCPPPTPTHRVQTVLAPQAGAQDSSSEVPAQPPWRLLSAAWGSCAVGTAPLVLLSTWFLPPFRGAAAQSPWQPHCLCRAPSGCSRLHLLCRVFPRPRPSRPALKTSNSRPPSGSSAWQTPHHHWKLEKFLSYRARDSPGVSALAAPQTPRRRRLHLSFCAIWSSLTLCVVLPPWVPPKRDHVMFDSASPEYLTQGLTHNKHLNLHLIYFEMNK